MAQRKPVFLDENVVAAILSRLIASGDKESVDVVLDCFMPDHLHAIVRGREEGSNVLNFMKSTGFWLKQQSPTEA